MPQDDNHGGPSEFALPGSPSDSDYDTSSGGLPQSAKLRDKLNKLADWRLDISCIESVNGAPEFRGGYATVSRALLASPSNGQSNPTKKDGLNLPGPAGEASRQRKDVAVKKMNMSNYPARVLGLTLREAEFLVGLSHVNVIKLEGFVEDFSKNVVWLVFPWAENGNLKNFIASAEWEIPERIWLISDVAKGVEYLHSQQPPIRHGDLKSINILVTSEYRAVITDFGSARRQTTEDLNNEATQVGNKPQPALSLEATSCAPNNTLCITLTGDHFTLRWAAPELLNEEKGTLASDIWALGCVVYEVMTNSIPFQDVINNNAVIVRVVKGDLPSVTDNARMSLIQALCSLMLACWSIDPGKRPTAETCQKSINWMPLIRPDPVRTADAAASRARSPALLMSLGVMYRQQGDYVNASDLFSKALGRYRDVGDSKGKAAALFELAQVHRFRNEYSQAVTFNSEALQICTDIGDRLGKANTLLDRAHVHRLQTEYSQAVTFYSEALQIYTDMGVRRGRADALTGLADVHRVQTEYSQAVTFYSEALQIRTDIGDRRGRASALWGLADVHRRRNEGSQAMTFYSEALDIYTNIGDRFGRGIALRDLAHVHRLRNQYSRASTLFSEALEIFTDIGYRYGRARSLSGLGDVHRDQGNYREAIGPYTEAAEVFEQIGDTQDAAYASNQAAKVFRLSTREEST